MRHSHMCADDRASIRSRVHLSATRAYACTWIPATSIRLHAHMHTWIHGYMDTWIHGYMHTSFHYIPSHNMYIYIYIYIYTYTYIRKQATTSGRGPDPWSRESAPPRPPTKLLSQINGPETGKRKQVTRQAGGKLTESFRF